MKKRKKEKLSINDINKNSGKNISHSINKIKENEKKYTIILVMFFMTLFLIIGYVSLRVKTFSLIDYSNDLSGAYVSLSSSVITLSEDDKISNNLGLVSDGIYLNLQNRIDNDYNYKIMLAEDDEIKNICGCSNELFNVEDIRYSIDGKTVKSISKNNMLITTGFLKMGGKDKINLKIWIDENSHSVGHFHGKIYFEKIEED